MKVRPGKNMVRAGLGLVLFSLLAFWWPPALMLLLLALLVPAWFAMADYRSLTEQLRQFSLKRSAPSTAGRDVPFPMELTFTNSASQPVRGVARDETPAAARPSFQVYRFDIPPQGQSVCSSEFRVPERGRHEFGPVWIRLEGPTRFLEGQQAIETKAAVKVLPETFSSKEGLQKDAAAQMLLLDKLTRFRQQGTGTEFESLSEYREGDDPRRIDWRATARSRHLVVRRYQVERHRDVMILIDCGRLMGAETGRGSKLDCAVDAGLMLCRVALDYGDRCGVGLFDDRVLGYLPPVTGISSLRRISESIYDAQSGLRETDFTGMFATLKSRQSKRALIVVISDIHDVETTGRFRESLLSLSQRHLVLFAALQTPLLEQIITGKVQSSLDGFRKMVAFRLLRERGRAVHSLKRGGVHVVDVLPEQLTVPLVNRFIELRQSNVL